MKAFRFRLQTKLDISIRQEQVAREELQRCLMERNRIEEELNKTLDRLVNLEQSIRDYDLEKRTFQQLLILKEYVSGNQEAHQRDRK
jgi:hypothetical protein